MIACESDSSVFASRSSSCRGRGGRPSGRCGRGACSPCDATLAPCDACRRLTTPSRPTTSTPPPRCDGRGGRAARRPGPDLGRGRRHPQRRLPAVRGRRAPRCWRARTRTRSRWPPATSGRRRRGTGHARRSPPAPPGGRSRTRWSRSPRRRRPVARRAGDHGHPRRRGPRTTTPRACPTCRRSEECVDLSAPAQPRPVQAPGPEPARGQPAGPGDRRLDGRASPPTSRSCGRGSGSSTAAGPTRWRCSPSPTSLPAAGFAMGQRGLGADGAAAGARARDAGAGLVPRRGAGHPDRRRLDRRGLTIWDSEGRLVVQARQLARLSRGR